MSDQVDGAKVTKDLQQGQEWLADTLASVDKQARSFMTEHPFISLACAVGVGFLAARLIGRKQ